MNRSSFHRNYFDFFIIPPYKDTIQLNRETDALVADLYYDGDGFFTSIIATSCTSTDFWSEIQQLLNQMRGN
ncbi:MAG: hypothetical protein WBK20_00365 [Spirochaetota bacterium]